MEAGVEIHHCDTSCSLSILDLKSESEVDLVVGAITRLNETALTTSLVPIRARTSGSLLDQANEIITRGKT